jgi:hypothetical protein
MCLSYFASTNLPLWRQRALGLRPCLIAACLLAFLAAATFLPVAQAQESGWGCEIGSDGQWNCHWSGKGDPSKPESGAQKPSPDSEDENRSAEAPAEPVAPESSSEERQVADTSSPPPPTGEQPKRTAKEDASTVSKLKSWFGFSKDSDKQEITQEAKKKGDGEPPSRNNELDNPVDSPDLPDDQQAALPKPDIEDIGVADEKPTQQEEQGSGRAEEGAKPSTMQRVKHWFGFSSNKTGNSVSPVDENKAAPSPSTGQTVQITPVAEKPQERKLNTAAKAPSSEDKLQLPTSIVQPILDDGEAKEEKPPRNDKRVSWLNRVGHWLGLSKEEKNTSPGKRTGTDKSGDEKVMPDMGVKDVPAE